MFADNKAMRRLKRSARKAATFRGHNLGRFKPLHSYTAVADCTNPYCHASVYCRINPAPNGIDISGLAVAVNCGNKECTYAAKHLAPPYGDDK